MDINNLTDQEKSALLMKMIGWELQEPGQALVDWFAQGGLDLSALVKQSVAVDGEFWFDETGAIHREGIPNLYESDSVMFAWRVLTWASTSGHFSQWPARKTQSPYDIFSEWWKECDIWEEEDLVAAMRLWLDKILSLVIEADMIKGWYD